MSKRMKILISVLAATLLLIVGGTMVVLAHEGSAPDGRPGMGDIIANNTAQKRCITILGISNFNRIDAAGVDTFYIKNNP